MKAPLQPSGNVSEMERWASIVGGIALIGYGLWSGRRRSARTWGALTFGTLLMARGATAQCALYHMLGVDHRAASGDGDLKDGSGKHLEAAVIVERPVGEVYAFWRHVENWPQLLPHIESVTAGKGNQFTCALKGAMGATVTWDAIITKNRPNELIAWQTLTHTGANNQGLVRFNRLSSDATEVQLVLDYHPESGSVGVATANALGEQPEQRLYGKLQGFKRRLETVST